MKCWAVIRDGRILTETVSPDRRGAIVNWLVVHAHQMVYDFDDDTTIERMWNRHRGEGARVAECTVEEVKS